MRGEGKSLSLTYLMTLMEMELSAIENLLLENDLTKGIKDIWLKMRGRRRSKPWRISFKISSNGGLSKQGPSGLTEQFKSEALLLRQRILDH